MKKRYEDVSESAKSNLDVIENKDDVISIFPLESLQNLDLKNVGRCKAIIGHGEIPEVWETPASMVMHFKPHMRKIDIRKRILSYLPDNIKFSSPGKLLIDEAVLWILRWGCLLSLGPVSRSKRLMSQRLDATTVAQKLYSGILKIVSVGIVRRFNDEDILGNGFVKFLKISDLQEIRNNGRLKNELDRIVELTVQGLWNDSPEKIIFRDLLINPKGAARERPAQLKSEPYIPIPDTYMAKIGPRIQWLILDFGPNLINFLESVPDIFPFFGDKWSINNNGRFDRGLSKYFSKNSWVDRYGGLLTEPPFSLRHGSGKGRHNAEDISKDNQFEWPPRTWDSFKNLSVCLQSANLWLTLLALAGRVGEVLTLKRDCVRLARDGDLYVNGKTYKLSATLAGEDRQWPVPVLLIDALNQQVKLVEAWQHIGRMANDAVGIEMLSVDESEHLWASIGAGKSSPEDQLAHFHDGIERFASRMGMASKPGGRNLHAHRFRKTIARLGALAIVGSPKVLMQLLGHRDITQTLGYMLTDASLAKEIDDIAREMRVMRSQELIEDMHNSLSGKIGPILGGHGGVGAAVYGDAVRNYEKDIHRTGKLWDTDTAHELAVLLTNNGNSFRLVSEHVICTKSEGEVGLCSPKKGEPDITNCKSKCGNRIEEKTSRRNVERVIPILIANANRSIADNDLLVLASYAHQLEEEMGRFEDIFLKWRNNSDVLKIMEAAA